MPSGRASKQRRRASTPAVRTRTSPPARKASPRVLIAAGALIAAVAVVSALAVVLGGGSSFSLKHVPAVGSLATALPGAVEVDGLLRGIPQHGTTLGKASAPVTLTEFIDPQCPYCGQFETQVLPSLIGAYVRSGKLRIQMEPWAFIGSDSYRGQAAELAAARQDKLFNFVQVLYDNQGPENSGWLTDSMIADIGASVPGLRVYALLDERGSAAVKAATRRVDALVETDKVDQTPTIYVGATGTRGSIVKMASATDKQAVVSAIAAAA